MFRLSALEWLILAVALLVCPAGSPMRAGNVTGSDRDGRYSRSEFGMVGATIAPPSAAAGGTRATSKPE